MTIKTVKILHGRHANLDSFPLRYGFSFSVDSTIELTYNDSTLKPDKTFKDRYNIIADFKNPKNSLKIFKTNNLFGAIVLFNILIGKV